MGQKKKSTLTAEAVQEKEVREPLPEGFLARLGLIGLEAIEPVILAALISADPLLLIGPHGVGKSHLLVRLAEALGLAHRHYNASLLSFDDLVGFPLPNGSGGLEYVRTPASIWGAQAVFLDEISRCRPEVQNKLFSIIHERRVQGLDLPDLRYRWSAMNPPPQDDEDSIYRGSEPLDAALADRFAFVVPIPDWSELAPERQEKLIRSGRVVPGPETAAQLRELVERGRRLAGALEETHAGRLPAYIRLICAALRQANLTLSPRRAVILLRNLCAVHAARLLFHPGADWEGSALLTLRNSIPQRATNGTVNELALLTAHKEAWRLSHIEVDSPLQFLIAESDPLRRALLAIGIPDLDRQEFSTIVSDSLAGLPQGARHALAAHLFETGVAGRLIAAVAQQCAEWYSIVATPQNVHEIVQSGGVRHRVWQAIVSTLSRFPGDDPETHLRTNLLAGLFAKNVIQVEADIAEVLSQWDRAWQTARGALV